MNLQLSENKNSLLKTVTLILVNYLLLVLVTSCIKFDPNQLKNNKTIESNNFPEVEMINFSADSYSLSNIKWILNADIAKFFDKDKMTVLNQINVFFYDKNQKQTTKIISDYGIYYESTQNFDLSNDVTITASNGKVLKGNFFKWDNAKETLSTHLNAMVSNKKTGEWHRGTGMIADKNLEVVNFFSNNVGGFKASEE